MKKIIFRTSFLIIACKLPISSYSIFWFCNVRFYGIRWLMRFNPLPFAY